MESKRHSHGKHMAFTWGAHGTHMGKHMAPKWGVRGTHMGWDSHGEYEALMGSMCTYTGSTCLGYGVLWSLLVVLKRSPSPSLLRTSRAIEKLPPLRDSPVGTVGGPGSALREPGGWGKPAALMIFSRLASVLNGRRHGSRKCSKEG